MGLGAGSAGSALPHWPLGAKRHPPVLGCGTTGILPVPPVNGVGWPAATIFLRVAILRYRGCWVWVLIAFWGTLCISAGSLPLQLDRQSDGGRRPEGRKDVRWRGRTRAGEGGGGWAQSGRAQEEVPWWLKGHQDEKLATSPEKADLDDTVTKFVCKSTHV